MLEKKERLEYFDIAKGIAILLVVLGHIINFKTPLSLWIYSFHMPIFFIIAGILIRYKNETKSDMKVVLKKKFLSLLVPYISFSLIYIVYEFYNSIIMHTMTLESFKLDIYMTLCLRGIGTLWFLPALFFGEVLFILIMKVNINKYFKVFVILLCFASSIFVGKYLGYENVNNLVSNKVYIIILTVFRSFVSLFFISIGYYFNRFIIEIKSRRYIDLVIGTILLIVDIILSKYDVVDLNFLLVDNVIIYIICGVIGSISLILICRFIKHNKILSFLGINSLIIFATHFEFPFRKYANEMVTYINTNILKLSTYHIETVTRLFVIILMELVVIIIINKFFPIILGKKRTRYVKS